MENNLERLEQIMKPYFDKKEEIEKLSNSNQNELKETKNQIVELREKRKQERAKLELRLERLRDNKDREIEEYVTSQPGFYAGYAATLRKDLEKAYKAQEDELIAEIKSFDAITEKQIENLEKSINSESDRNYFIDMTGSKDILNQISDANKKIIEIKNRPNYNRVYLREMIDVKNSLRKQLIAEQRKITLAFQREKINFDSVMLELSNFKYQYNDQHQVINGLEWKELYEKSNEISNKLNELRNSLKVVEEYLNLTELTKDEIAASMASLAPWEKAEYDRRNIKVADQEQLNSEAQLEEELPVIQELEEIDKSNEQEKQPEILDQINKIKDELENDNKEKKGSKPDDLIDSYTPVIADGKYTFDGTDTIFENMDDFCDVIYKDLVSEVDGMNSIKIDNSSNSKINYFSEKEKGQEDYNYVGSVNNKKTLMLPTGVFLNYDDINQAINKFRKKNKKDAFIVKEQNKEYKLSKLKIKEFKQALKECVAIELVKARKLGNMDIKHVFVKENQESFDNATSIGKVATKLPEGIYISRDQLKDKLQYILKPNERKKLEWLKKLDWFKKLSTKVNPLSGVDVQETTPEGEIENIIEQETIKQR